MINLLIQTLIPVLMLNGWYSPTRTLDAAFPVRSDHKSVQNLDFIIGENLSDVLMAGCPVIAGAILNVSTTGQQDSLKVVDFSMTEVITRAQRPSTPRTRFMFYIRSSNKASDEERILENVELRPGIQLVVGDCDSSEGLYKLVLSDQRFFDSVRNVVALHEQGFMDKASAAEIIKKLEVAPDRVVVGYVLQQLWRAGYDGDLQKRADVLVRLLGSRQIPKPAQLTTRLRLIDYLSGNAGLPQPTRRRVVQDVIRLGGGKDPDSAREAISLLVQLINNEKLSLAPYRPLDVSLARNYNSLLRDQLSPSERHLFETQLFFR